MLINRNKLYQHISIINMLGLIGLIKLKYLKRCKKLGKIFYFKLKLFNDKDFILRSGTSDYQVFIDTFIKKYHLPPPPPHSRKENIILFLT